MGSFFKTVATSGAVALTLSTAAHAADFPRSLPPPAPPLPPPVQRAPVLVDEFASGWYLRGDAGYRWNSVDSAVNADPAAPIIASEMRDSLAFGLGVGYKWQWFRADLTADYGTIAKYTGTTPDLPADMRVKIDSYTTLVNVYGDLGTWFGLTPYIGAGAGGAYLRAHDFMQAFLPPVDNVAPTTKWNFAWAWMAGLSYKITNNAHLDVGYRHIRLGDIGTGTDAYGNQLELSKLSADEVRIGFRYLID